MANIINNQDPNRHVPSAAETGSVEKLAKQFKGRYGTFSDAEGENIVIFARNADNFMTQNLIPSLEMGMIIAYNLKGEPYIRAKRWRDTMGVDPERINADHWREQPYQAATPFMPYQPCQIAQVMIPARPAGIDIHGNPDPHDPGHPGQPQLPFIEMRPPVSAVREQVAVDANYCLKAYLLHTFQKRVDVTAAEKFLATFRTQQPKQTCTAFIDAFMVKFEHYITVRWTPVERDAPNFRENANTIRLQYIKEGFCREFKKHLDANPQVVTHQQVDDEVQRWARETIEGREFTQNCNKSEASYTTAGSYLDNRSIQDDENDDNTESSSPTPAKRKPKDTFTRSRGGGTKGGRPPYNNGRNPTIDQRQPEPIKQPRDTDGRNNNNQTGEQRLTPGLSILATIGETLARFGAWMIPKTPQEKLGIQGPATHLKTPTPITLTITDPEDAKWLTQATNSGLDPATIITACRQRQQYHNQPQANSDQSPQTPRRISYLLPSGLVACNECTHVSANFKASDKHQNEAHPKLVNGPDCRN